MVSQGDIIKISFNPVSDHEQAGFRPVLVVSNNTFNSNTNLVIAAPISNTDNGFPLHLPLEKEKTSGFVLCEHIWTLDIKSGGYKFVEKVRDEKLDEVLLIIRNEI